MDGVFEKAFDLVFEKGTDGISPNSRNKKKAT